MFPVLFEFGSFRFYSYGFFIILGYFAGLIIAIRQGKHQNVSRKFIVDTAFYGLLIGLVGARLLYIFTNPGVFDDDWYMLFAIWQGGGAYYGGFVCSLLWAYFFCKWKGVPLGKLFDLASPSVAIAHAFGRVGCFAAGCCHGDICHFPWGFYFNTSFVAKELRGLPLHPTQLYEAFGLFLIFFFLLFWQKKKRYQGQTFVWYLLSYGILRFLLETVRADDDRGYIFTNYLSTSQFISVVLIGLALFIAWRNRSISLSHQEGHQTSKKF